MKRVESTLRHVSMLFIMLNLLSPLSVSYAVAQTLPPATPQEEQAPPPAEEQVIETVDTTGSSEQQAPAPVVEAVDPEPSNEPQESTGQSPPADPSGTEPAPSAPETQPTPVTPQLPTMANGYCAEDGVTLVPASVIAAPNTGLIAYTLQGPDESGAFTVVAALVDSEATVWSTDTFVNWVDAGNNTVAYSGTVTTIPCPVIEQPTETETPTETPTEEPAGTPTQTPTETPADLIKVTPQDPTIENGVCKDGKAIAPKVTPAGTEGLTYEVTGPDKDGTFALTATLQDGYTWGDTFSDWGVDGNVATYVKTTVEIEPCAPKKRSLTTQSTGDNTAEYTIQKSVDPSTVAQGMDITYTIVVGWGPEVANTPFTISDLIPAPLTNVSSTGCTFVVPDGAVDCSGGGAGGAGTVLTWNVNPNGYTGSVYITVNAHVPTGTAGSVVTNYAYVGNVGSSIVAANTFTVLDKLPEVVKTQPGIVGVGQAQCLDGAVTTPTLTLPVTTGITYSAFPSGPYSPGQTVTVTATLNPGYAFDTKNWPNGWTQTSDVTATYTVRFNTASCKDATPKTGTPNAGVCEEGVAKNPTYKLPGNTSSVHYGNLTSTDNGNSVTFSFTAELQNGYAWTDPSGWPANGGSWTRNSPTRATYTITIPKAECTSVKPVDPVVKDGICKDGTYTAPVISTTNTDAITYSVTGPDSNGNFTVTATLKNGYAWGTMPQGWTKVQGSNTQAQFTGKVDLNTCGELTPVTPVATQAVCNPGGSFTDPTLTPANGHVENGITYTYDATKVKNNGGTVVITATLSGANKWGNLNGTGWTVDSQDATKATYTVIFTNVQCGTVSPATPVVNQAVCRPDGSITAPSFTVGPTANIDYTWTPDTATNGGSVTITATLKGANSWGDLNGWDRKSDTQATFTINFDNVKCQTAELANPVIQQAVCLAGGEIQDPSLSIGPSAGVTYAFNRNDVRNGGTVTITAKLAEGYAWGNTTGWSTTNNPRELTRDVTFQNVECASVLPVAPIVNEAVCTDGVVTTPSYTKPTTTGIVYTYSDEDLTPGGGVTVTATVQQGYAFGTLKDGWTMVEGSTTQATIRVSFKNTTCTGIQLATPDVSQAVCTGGELKAPTVTIAETDGVTYVVSPESFAPGSKVVITATVKDGYGWPDTLPGNWVKENATTATNTFTLDSVECEQVIPAAPQVSNAVCTDGALTDPQVILQETDGITYTMEGAVTNGGTVVVTATLADGKAWGEMPQGWTTQSPTTATYTVELDDVQCAPVIPVTPDVVNTVCVEGGLTNPSVTPATTEGIVYAMNGDVVNGGTVIVTATIQDGFAWGEMPVGWEKIDNATATFTVELDDVSCTDVVPVAPLVVNTVCTEGGLTDPRITPVDIDGVVYSYNMDEVVNGGTVVVTATIQDGYAWGDLADSGWTMQDAATATFTVVLEQVECAPVVPANPIVTNAVCTGGELTVPTMTTGETDGIVYAFNQEDVKNGGAVLVTATLADGYEWGIMPEGWTRVDSVTATYTVQFADAECEVGLPENPIVAAPACVDGQVTKPSITLPVSDDIVYTMTGDVVPGGTVVVTATVVDGYAWESTEVEGWTFVDAATATYTVKFDTAECPPVTPETPVDPGNPVPQSPASPVTNLPVTGSGSIGTGNQDLAILMLSTAALALATVALGIRRRAPR